MPTTEADAERGAERWLRSLGARLRDTRVSLRVSMTAAAQSAEVSRMTWHRMESGSPSVSAGSYARALDVLGIAETDELASTSVRPIGMIPTRIRVGDWPELAALAWSLQPDTLVTPREALELYERNFRHLNPLNLTESEQALIEDLRDGLGDEVRA